MIHDGKLKEITLPRTQRFHGPASADRSYPPDPGCLLRTDRGGHLPQQTAEELRDDRPAW